MQLPAISEFNHFPDLERTERVAVSAPAPGVHALIRASSDEDAVRLWLERYESEFSYNNSLKEAQRFLGWLRLRQMSLAQVAYEDVVDYARLLRQPPENWIGRPVPKTLPNGQLNPAWRPFAGPLSESSAKKAESVLSAMFGFLVEARYLGANPWRLRPRLRGKGQSGFAARVKRKISMQALQALRDWLEAMDESADEAVRRRAARSRWMVALFYYSGARRGEVAAGVMGDVRLVEGRWWWTVNGKTGEGAIPAVDPFLKALAQYRLSLGLSPLPRPDDQTAMLTDAWGAGKPIGDSAIYRALKQVLHEAGDWLEQRALEAVVPEQASQWRACAAELRQVSPHWFRHTAATDQLREGIPLVVVSQNLRHKSVATTGIYLMEESRIQHETTAGSNWAQPGLKGRA